jgi:hypothetical protein
MLSGRPLPSAAVGTRAGRRLDGPRLACVGAVAVMALFRGLIPADSDTPWHIAEGQLLRRRWADGVWELGRSDSFSWTARGNSWHPNSWAFDALMGALYDAGGWAALALLRLALLGVIVALAWRYSRWSSAGAWARAGAVWICAVFVIPTGAMRPQLATFVIVLAGLELTQRILSSRSRPPVPMLAGLAALMSVGSMLHGGVIAAVAVVGAACAGHMFDTRQWRLPVLVTALAFAGSCLSPLGVSIWTYAVRTGGDSRRQGIDEWQPPSLHQLGDVAMLALLLAIVGWAVLRLRPDTSGRRWTLVAPAILTTAMTFLAMRNATFALLSSVPIMAASLSRAGEVLDRRGWRVPVRPGMALAAMTLGGILGGAIQTGEFTLDPNPLDSAEFPAVTARSLPAGCRLLNEYHFGGYLILARPDIPVSQDGRNDLYGTERLLQQRALFNDGDPATAVPNLERAGITCVLAEPDRPLVQALGRDPSWRRAAANATAQAWVKMP